MARPREFDETKVLEAAMNCFWAQGFEQISLRDLTERMRSPAPAWHRRRTTELAYRSQSICARSWGVAQPHPARLCLPMCSPG